MLLEAEERAYLEQVKTALGREIERLLEKAEGYSKDSYEAVRYMWEHREEFDDSERLFNRNIAEGIADVGNETKRQLSRMVKLLDSPYFAGIDFLMENETEPMKVYIGKFSFFDRADICRIYDWRSPVASMYYEFEDGEAYYDAPVGRIRGRLTGKRQYKINRGVLEGVYESSNIRDEILLQTLAQTSDTKMRDIAATIQKEQNALIRNETAEILIVQGVAGSGKTSVALHRIAYFLYRYRKEISAENFLILSPNGVFVDYISNVLPELGEERVRCMEMDDVTIIFLYRRIIPMREVLFPKGLSVSAMSTSAVCLCI